MTENCMQAYCSAPTKHDQFQLLKPWSQCLETSFASCHDLCAF